jgi:glyoxylase-like metal-dependent hydrolase (beta-lactamase superfamily II)
MNPLENPALRVGDIAVWPVLDGALTLAEPVGFPTQDSDGFDVHKESVSDGKLHLDIGGFLVRAGDRIVLIDAGAGPGDDTWHSGPDVDDIADAPPPLAARYHYLNRYGTVPPKAFLRGRRRTKIRTGSFGANLAALGCSPADVTDVVLSHLHFDHIGWVSMDGAPYFPNAVIRCEGHDAEHFLRHDRGHDDDYFSFEYGAMSIKQRMAPVLGRLETWHEDAELAPGISARFTPGHTPGSSAFVLTSGRDRAMILGDAVHCPYELENPDFNRASGFSVSDADGQQADASRQAIRDEAIESEAFVSAPHFPGLRFGRLHLGETPRSWRFGWAPPTSP